jgi:hypothetical protein
MFHAPVPIRGASRVRSPRDRQYPCQAQCMWFRLIQQGKRFLEDPAKPNRAKSQAHTQRRSQQSVPVPAGIMLSSRLTNEFDGCAESDEQLVVDEVPMPG